MPNQARLWRHSSETDGAGAHHHGPRQRSQDVLDEGRTAHGAGREDLHQVATQFHGVSNLGHGAATRAIRNAPAVAQRNHFLYHAGRNHEIGPHLDVLGSRGSIQDGTGTQGQFRALLADKADELLEHLVGAVAPVGKLKGADTAVVAGFHHLLRQFHILVVEYRHDTRRPDFSNRINFLKLCHMRCCYLDTRPLPPPAIRPSTSATVTRL